MIYASLVIQNVYPKHMAYNPTCRHIAGDDGDGDGEVSRDTMLEKCMGVP